MADDLGSDSFRLLFEEHFERLVSFTRSILGSDLEAEDVAQEAFVILHLRRARLRPGVSPRPYLYRVAFRLCLARLRRNARCRILAILFGALTPQEASAPSNPVDLSFTGLPSRQRAIAHLHFAEDLSPSEIARELGIAPSTVRVQLGRVRNRLRAEVSSPASADRCPNAT